MDGQHIGQRLGSKTSPDTASRQFGINGPQSSHQLGGIQRVERGQRLSGITEGECSMRKSIVCGCGIMVAAVVIGCGSSSSPEAVIKEQLSIMDQMAGIMEKVTDKKSF
jgi:hypothetical protein